MLYLIRHAATEPQATVDAAQWTLSEAGWVAAAALAGKRFWSSVDRVISSTERKAIATAAPTVELWRLPIEHNPAFDEVRRGGWTEAYAASVATFFQNPHQPLTGWECAAHAQGRAVAALESLLQRYPHQRLALVGHGLLWALLRAHLLGQPQVNPDEWRAIQMPDVAVWQGTPEGWQLRQDFEGIRAVTDQRFTGRF